MKNKLKYIFYNILSYLNSHFINIKGKNNKINKYEIRLSGLQLKIIGNRNEIILGCNSNLKNLKLEIYGSNNKVIIGNNNVFYANSIIRIGDSNCDMDNGLLEIGEWGGFQETEIVMLESYSKLHIGHHCMSANGVTIFVSDTHAILDEKKKCINIGKECYIGDNVWIGRDVKIGKNAHIPNNTIIGWNAVVMSKFTEENTILAGIPAKIIKRNISHDWRSPQKYINEVINNND